MRFIFEVEDFANHSSAQHQFHIKKNGAGNYCAYHTNTQLSYMRVMLDGSVESVPFCWAKRKRDLDNALSEISEYYPEEIEKQFLDKYIAKQLGIHSYGEPYSHWVSLEDNEKQFEDLQYRNNNWYNGDIEVASDASDEQPDFDDENTTRKINFSNVDKIFIVTVLGRPQFEVRAFDRNEAARKVRKYYGQKVKILGIKEK